MARFCPWLVLVWLSLALVGHSETSIPLKGQPNSSAVKAEERNPPIKQGGKVEPMAEKPKEMSGARENNRKFNPITPGKRRYQTVSVYQFIYPEKSMYYCNREMMKQQLRAIYLNKRHQIKHRTTVSQPEVSPPQRGSNSPDPICPMGCEFLRSVQNRLTSHGLPNLMCKINNLGLMSGKSQTTAPHYPFASKQPSLLVEGLQRPNSPEKQISPEGSCGLGKGCQVGVLLQENVLTAVGCAEPPESSPLSNMDCKVKDPNLTLGEKNQHVLCPEEEDDSHCNVETTNAERAIGDQLSSSPPSH